MGSNSIDAKWSRERGLTPHLATEAFVTVQNPSAKTGSKNGQTVVLICSLIIPAIMLHSRYLLILKLSTVDSVANC